MAVNDPMSGKTTPTRSAASDVPAKELTETQRDALIELINIGFGRAAASLSQLTGQRVLLETPQVSMGSLNTLFETLNYQRDEEVAAVQQIITGPVAGDAMLLLDQPSALLLKQLLTDEPDIDGRFDGTAKEVLMEVGNIVLNACLGTFGNLLKVSIAFAVPRLRLDSLHDIVTSLMINTEELRYALVVQTGFRLKESAIKGNLIMILSMASLERLLEAVNHWEQQHI